MAFKQARGLWPLSLLLGALLAGCGGSGGSGGGGGDGDADSSTYSAEIRRTEMGVPHIKAADWGGVGYGLGYAQAEDNLCTMADSFLTYRGERSRYLGPDAQLVYDSTISRPRNIDSDFFHKHVISDDVVAAMTAAQSASMVQLVDGFAAGYNRYVKDLKAGGSAHAACRGAAWVMPITAQDIWRRMYAANLAGGYSNFLQAIANAQPPGGTKSAAPAVDLKALAGEIRAPRMQVGGTMGIGSNMYGFGTAATGDSSPVLFGNPHWYWKGPDRFYQAQLTIPGELNVSGVSFLGIPVILIGFNDNVAWSHTVSTARRFGFFQLTLDPADPTSYLVDGKSTKMQAHTVSVQVQNGSGTPTTVTRTLYKTAYGPMVDLSALHPALGWSAGSAFAIRDINGENFRTFRNWMRWDQAKSLDEFIAIQKEESAIPWVNTVAVGRGGAKTWYADIGAVPNVSPEQVADCTTPVGQAMAAALPATPIFDGARSACQWQSDPDSVQPGAVGPSRMPSLLRADYVANMNDSYWLANVHAPLTGYPAIFGPAGTAAQSLRTRLGHTMALERLAGTDGYPGNKASSDIVRQMVLNSRVFSAERFKDQALDMVCSGPGVAADVVQACTTLRAWNNQGNSDARGSHIWDEFWSRITLPDAKLFAVPFDPADPLNTPRDLQASAAPVLQQAFGAAVQAVKDAGFALDAARGDVLFTMRGGSKTGLFGGCGAMGYFTVTCSENPIGQGGYTMDGQPHGNSYMQVVSFPGGAVQAYTFLTFSLSDDPASPHYSDYTKAYAAKEWMRVPFTESEIMGDKNLQTTTLQE